MTTLARHRAAVVQALLSITVILAAWAWADLLFFGVSASPLHSIFYLLRAVVLVAVMALFASRIVRQEEHQAQVTNLRFRRVMEALGEAVIGVNSGGTIIYANPAALSLLGYPTMIGLPLVAIIPPAWRERHMAGWVAYLTTGEGRILGKSVKAPIQHAKGYQVPVVFTLTEVQNGERQFFAIVRPVDSDVVQIDPDVDLWQGSQTPPQTKGPLKGSPHA